ncbi:MAG: DUF2513 domain-containing protein [Pirellulales bacterium]
MESRRFAATAAFGLSHLARKRDDLSSWWQTVEARLKPATDGTIHLQGGRTALTWSGHEFLDAARDEGRWTEAKRLTKEKAGSITMAALTQILTRLMTQALGM